MFRRPAAVWVLFSLCMILAAGFMFWISSTALQLQKEREEAEKQADLEENVRLALWRMEGFISPILGRETGRFLYEYMPFYSPGQAYSKMYSKLSRGDVLVPSPLLEGRPEYIRLYFQFSSDGEVSSPQVPLGNMRDIAEMRYTTSEKINEAADLLKSLGTSYSYTVLSSLIGSEAGPEQTGLAAESQNIPEQQTLSQSFMRQESLNNSEYFSRQGTIKNTMTSNAQVIDSSPGHSPASKSSIMHPVWNSGRLFLLRKVTVEGLEYIQGCLLDWERIENALKKRVKDILPEAELVMGVKGNDENRKRLMTGLPVLLEPGKIKFNNADSPSVLKIMLGIGWLSVCIAGISAAFLFKGILTLSERRAAFVSAVTHELRTPLTTFRMYSEMLSEGMVTDPEDQKEYLQKLCTESDRLNHLIENVLAYSRIEKRRPVQPPRPVTVAEFEEHSLKRLKDRAESEGFIFTADIPAQLKEAAFLADLPAVEQILLNLIDNSCKYGRCNTEPCIRVSCGVENTFFCIRTEDNGPGIHPSDMKRIFRPFSKTAKDAAGTAPGVGLGLSLSRRLAKAMHGELTVCPEVEKGACFKLSLPLHYQ